MYKTGLILILFFLNLDTSYSKKGKVCSDGFVAVGGYCYRLVITRVSWYKAFYACRQLGAFLVTIDTQQKQNDLVNYINQHDELKNESWSQQELYPGFWLSGTDVDEEGVWVWASTGRPVSFTDWNSGEPNNLYLDNEPENCLQLQEFSDFKWNDVLCSVETGYICE